MSGATVDTTNLNETGHGISMTQHKTVRKGFFNPAVSCLNIV